MMAVLQNSIVHVAYAIQIFRAGSEFWNTADNT